MTKIKHSTFTLKRRPKTNLKSLLLLYEKNYLILNKIIPDFNKNLTMCYLLPEGKNNSKVTIELIKDSKYTSTLIINQSKVLDDNLLSTKIKVAIYHDFKMAEVRTFNGRYLFWAINRYPNKNMFHKDEKFQWNKFLLEWLSFSKKEGLADKVFNLSALI